MIDTFLSQGAQPMYNGNGPGSWGGHMMYSPFGGLFPILLLVLAVAVAVILLKGRFGRDGSAGHDSSVSPDRERESPLDILKRRYAAGEIDKDQYEMMKRDLAE